MKCTGIDMHPATFVTGILDQEGDTPVVQRWQPSAKNLIDMTYAVGGPMKVAVEESGMANSP